MGALHLKYVGQSKTMEVAGPLAFAVTKIALQFYSVCSNTLNVSIDSRLTGCPPPQIESKVSPLCDSAGLVVQAEIPQFIDEIV